MSKKVRNGLLIGGFVAALITFIWWYVGYYLDSWHEFVRAVSRYFVVRQFTPTLNPLGWTPWAYLFMTVVAGVIAGFLIWNSRSSYGSWRRNAGEKITRIVAVSSVLTLVFGAYTVTGMWNDDKDEAESYLSSTEFVVKDYNNLPKSLKPLTDGASFNGGEHCAYGRIHAITSCITKGDLPLNWEGRNAPFSGASIVIPQTSGSVPNTDIMEETLTYLFGENERGVWSAIRNGLNRQPLDSIVQWDGANKPTNCEFSGKYDLQYAFDGNWGQNLTDTLARDFPGLLFDYGDMWGYCKEHKDETIKEPVIVIPVVTQESYGRRTTLQAAGVLIITGSSSGEPVIVRHTSVEAGSLPGPTYPLKLVDKQHEMLMWSAGRAVKNRNGFGYERTNVASQNGNTGNYLMRDKDSQRLFWVTPMRPKGSKGQELYAYSLTAADEVHSGSLNRQRIYVLADGDERVANLTDMDTRVNMAVRAIDQGFFSGQEPGRIVEFLPVNEKTWQAFAELKGRIVYRIEVPIDARVKSTVQVLDSSVDALQGCNNISSSTSVETLAECLSKWQAAGKPISEELSRRFPK